MIRCTVTVIALVASSKCVDAIVKIENIIDSVFEISMALAILYNVMQSIISSKLRRRFPGEWEKIGMPGPFFNISILSNYLFVKYLMKSSCKEVSEKSITLLFVLAKVLFLLGSSMMVFSFILFVAI